MFQRSSEAHLQGAVSNVCAQMQRLEPRRMLSAMPLLDPPNGTAGWEPRQFTTVGRDVFFEAQYGSGLGLFVTDGTRSGTHHLSTGSAIDQNLGHRGGLYGLVAGTHELFF